MVGAITYTAARPSLVVSDVEQSLKLYRDVLGFVVEAVMGEPPNFAILCKDAAAVALVQHDEVYDVGGAGVNIYVDVTDVDALHDICAAASIEMSHPLTSHPWGMRDFVIVDPDGHKIAFGQRV